MIRMFFIAISEEEAVFVGYDFFFPVIVVVFVLDRLDCTVGADVVFFTVLFYLDYGKGGARVIGLDDCGQVGLSYLRLGLVGQVVFELFAQLFT